MNSEALPLIDVSFNMNSGADSEKNLKILRLSCFRRKYERKRRRVKFERERMMVKFGKNIERRV